MFFVPSWYPLQTCVHARVITFGGYCDFIVLIGIFAHRREKMIGGGVCIPVFIPHTLRSPC